MFDYPAEPWDTSTMPTVPTRNVDEIVDGRIDTESSVPQYLVEQNRVTHTLAYRLQQSFIQARVDGLGKPSEVALEEFVDTCMEAHRKGIGPKELQLQLILEDGSLAGAFSLRSQRFSNDPIFDENWIRSLWVRFYNSNSNKKLHSARLLVTCSGCHLLCCFIQNSVQLYSFSSTAMPELTIIVISKR